MPLSPGPPLSRAHSPASLPQNRSDMPWPVRANAVETYTNVSYQATLDLFTSLRQQGLRIHYWP